MCFWNLQLRFDSLHYHTQQSGHSCDNKSARCWYAWKMYNRRWIVNNSLLSRHFYLIKARGNEYKSKENQDRHQIKYSTFVPPFSHIHLTIYSNTCHVMSVLNLLKLSIVIWSSYVVYNSRFISPTNLPWPKAQRQEHKSIPYNQQFQHCFLASWRYPYHFI